MADKKFLDEDGVSQFAEETKKYIDKHIDNADIHVTADDKTNWNGKQDALTAEQLAAVNSGINAIDKGNYDAHVANADIHVTAADKANWSGKQDALTSQQIDNINDVVNKANASDLTAHTNNVDIHVTAADKANWNGKQDALTSQQLSNIDDIPNKANSSDLNNYLPLSGGQMTGSIKRNVNNSWLVFAGGTDAGKGASLWLYGEDQPTWSNQFFIGTAANWLIGKPDGSLTWGGKQVVTEPNSIPFHNTYPRCKYLGTSITDAQNTAIKNRTYDDLFIGDYWTINGVNWRIVAIDYYYNVGDTNFDKGNIIVMPDTVLYNAQMNSTNTTAGAYYSSLMRTQNLNNARTIARNAFGSHLANHRIILANTVDASGPSNWAWYDSDGVELPNEVQIFGTRVWGSALKGFDVATQKQQFPLMALAPQFVNIRQTYWLQDVSSSSVSSSFAAVYSNGYAGNNYASGSCGVRPSVTLTYI